MSCCAADGTAARVFVGTGSVSLAVPPADSWWSVQGTAAAAVGSGSGAEVQPDPVLQAELLIAVPAPSNPYTH